MATAFPTSVPKEIEREVSTYRQHITSIKKHEGEFVLIQGSTVVDYFSTYGAAINSGYKRFNGDNFMVKQVGSSPVILNRCGIVKHDGKLRLAKAKKRV